MNTAPRRTGAGLASSWTNSQVVATVFDLSFTVRDRAARVVAVGGDVSDAEEAAERLEALAYRFDPDDQRSEVAAINRHAGSPVSCSLETVLLAGVVGELIGMALVADAQAEEVTVAEDTSFNPGVVGRGVAVDMTFCDLEQTDVLGVYVSLGELTRAAGCSPRGGAWNAGRGGQRLWPSDGAVLHRPGVCITAATAIGAVKEFLLRAEHRDPTA